MKSRATFAGIFVLVLSLTSVRPGEAGRTDRASVSPSSEVASSRRPLKGSSPEIHAEDLRSHVKILASEQMEGRLTGSNGEKLATRYVADAFSALALEPAGDSGSYFQRFPFTAGVTCGPQSHLEVAGQSFVLSQDWVPLPLSSSGSLTSVEGIFVGYGIRAPGMKDGPAIDSFAHLDVKGRFVLVLEGMPVSLTSELRAHLASFSGLRQKAAAAKSAGAVGMVVVSSSSSLSGLTHDATYGSAGLPVLGVTSDVGAALVSASGNDLQSWRQLLEKGEPIPSPVLKGVSLTATLDIAPKIGEGRNVIARLTVGTTPSSEVVVLGAHIDHLGKGETGEVHEDARGQIHFGADDNASGVAGLLELAQHLVALKRQGTLVSRRDILFAAWSGEEIGLLGSTYFVNHYAGKEGATSLRPEVAAYLNMDMIGRSTGQVVILGMASSPDWKALAEELAKGTDLSVSPRDDTFMPTDATAFYLKGVPVLSFFTGAHTDYNTPNDTWERLNYPLMEKVTKLVEAFSLRVLALETPPSWQAARAGATERRGTRRVTLGTVPDFAASGIVGLKISGVTPGGPAAAAGLVGGDVIVSLAGKPIANIQDFMGIMETLTIGEAVPVAVERQGQRLELRIIPAARQ